MSDDSRPPADQTPPNPAQRRYLLTDAAYQSVVEQLIVEAQEQGKFDNLRGRGKPLVIEQNPHAGDAELAYKLLKDNDFTLPWIAARNDLLEAIAAARAQMRRQWQQHGPHIEALERVGQTAVAERRRLALRAQWQTLLDDLNKRIESVNLLLPVRQLELFQLRIEAELARLGAERAADRPSTAE